MIHFSSLFAYSPLESIKASYALIKLKILGKNCIDITADDLQRRLDSGEPITIVDCRRPSVFKKIGHIPGAINHPAMTFEEHCHAIPKDRQVAVVCYFGYFCQIAAQQLIEQGHKDVLSMEGGMEEWIMTGKPIRK